MGNNEADITAINALYDQWIGGLVNDEFELFISVWADDAIRMEANSPPISCIENLRTHFMGLFKQFHIECGVYGDSEVQVSDNWAFYRGNYTLALTPKDGGPRTNIDGKWLDILIKYPDGSWKVYIDSVSDNKPPQVE
jgi:ketosteroid isomerase-like protein